MPPNTKPEDFLQQKLDERIKSGLYRTLIHSEGKIDFSSNDYLGLARSAELRASSNDSLPAGATGSRLISGNHPEAERSEAIVSAYHAAESALIFNCGYMANVGLFSSIASKGDTVISDEYIHASIIDGIRLSTANKFKFRHNDLSDLDEKLSRASGNKFVAVESLYSMDGDLAPLTAIAELCEKHEAMLIVDEAHATGVFGEDGEGLVCKYHLQNKVFATVYTFGKALGLHGAAVCGSNVLRNFLINFARPFIYSTAMPPHAYTQIQNAYKLLPAADRNTLMENIKYFRSQLERVRRFDFINSFTQIQGVLVGDNQKAKALAGHLFSKGIYAKAILSPTVPEGTERIRICLHSYNTKEEIDLLLDEINNFRS